MRRIERPDSWDLQPIPLDASYDDARQSVLVRLHGEQTHLALLADGARIRSGRAYIRIRRLETFAHRLHGAAAVFGLPELHDASKALELAACAAAIEHSLVREPLVQKTMLDGFQEVVQSIDDFWLTVVRLPRESLR